MKIVRVICCFFLLLMGIVAISQPIAALAQDENGEGQLEMTTTYPKLEITSVETAEFEVELKYTGDEPRIFDLAATGPKDWSIQLSASYAANKKIASILLDPSAPYGERVKVSTTPAFWLKPEPGDFKITLEVTSGELKNTIELTVVITATYTLDLVSATGRLNTSATAGKDNYFSIAVENNGSAAIDDIALSSNKPGEWSIEFTPHKIDTLAAGDFQTIDVNIKPPPKTIAGDYLIALRASGKQTTAKEISVRVTVETPTVWGWVGVIIVVAVVAGLIFAFRRFSRR